MCRMPQRNLSLKMEPALCRMRQQGFSLKPEPALCRMRQQGFSLKPEPALYRMRHQGLSLEKEPALCRVPQPVLRRLHQQGFSLIETLVALLLFSLSFSALMQYQLALADGFQRQWQQRSAWRYAHQLLLGQPLPTGWQGQRLQQPGPAGCQLLAARVVSPAGRRAELTQLRCAEPPDGTARQRRGRYRPAGISMFKVAAGGNGTAGSRCDMFIAGRTGYSSPPEK